MYMAGVEIKCAYQRCCWKGKLEDYETHLKECAAKELERVRDDAEKFKAMATSLDQKESDIAELKKSYAIAMRKVSENIALQTSQKEMFHKLRGMLAYKRKEVRELLAIIKDKDQEVFKKLVVEEVKNKRERSCSRN